MEDLIKVTRVARSGEGRLNQKLPQLPNFGPFNSIKLGSGVLGKTAPVMIAFLFILGLAIWKIPADLPYIVLGLVLLAAGMVSAYIWRAFLYAEANPGPAVLEGLHLVKFRQNELRASDPRVIDASPGGSQNGPPPSQLRDLSEGSIDD